jgi:hypothetical protein
VSFPRNLPSIHSQRSAFEKKAGQVAGLVDWLNAKDPAKKQDASSWDELRGWGAFATEQLKDFGDYRTRAYSSNMKVMFDAAMRVLQAVEALWLAYCPGEASESKLAAIHATFNRIVPSIPVCR